MKKVLMAVVVLTMVAASVFALVACGTSDPNEFLKNLEKADEFTAYAYNADGEVVSEISKNKAGEICVIQEAVKAYAIKDGDNFIIYTFLNGKWTKSQDKTLYDTYMSSVKLTTAMSLFADKLVKGDDGYWVLDSGLGESAYLKMEDGLLVSYIKNDDKYVKTSAIELKSNIKLPDEAKEA